MSDAWNVRQQLNTGGSVRTSVYTAGGSSTLSENANVIPDRTWRFFAIRYNRGTGTHELTNPDHTGLRGAAAILIVCWCAR
jgi:hypothetical protein